MDTKKVLALVACALLMFYVIAQPWPAADAVTSILDWLRDGLMALVGFVSRSFGGG